MSWTTITLDVTTPLFNDGGDDDAGLRVPSLLGAMRFWFRALAGAHLGPDLPAVAAWEARVFGGASAGGDDRSASSPVQWRIPRQPASVPTGTTPAWLPSHGRRGGRHGPPPGQDRWLVYLLGQGLADLRNCTLTRGHVPPGQQIDLKFRRRQRTDDAALGLALTSLWLTAAFGGVGARTRRGFGGIRILGCDNPDLPAPWDRLDLTTPPTYAQLSHLFPDAAGFSLALLSDASTARSSRPLVHRWAQDPPFPVLGARPGLTGRDIAYVHLGSKRFETWALALQDAAEGWRWMRACKDAPGVPYRPERKTAEWEDAIHGDDTEFPLGALGLPVVFKDGWQVNLRRGDQPLRRASPLWIRPVFVDGKWRIFTFVFRSQLLPTDATVSVLREKAHVKTVDVTLGHLDDWWRDWTADLSPSAARP